MTQTLAQSQTIIEQALKEQEKLGFKPMAVVVLGVVAGIEAVGLKADTGD